MKIHAIFDKIIILVLCFILAFFAYTFVNKVEKTPETAIQLASTITVLRPSFLTVKQIDDFVKGTGLAGLGKYFIEAERQSGIGADYLLSIAWHESGKGYGPWAVEPWHNLFSWGITDSGPNSEAVKIRDTMTREEAIIYVANQIKTSYLTKGGTYYKGETLGSIGQFYASDSSWASGVIAIHNNFVKTLDEKTLALEWGFGSQIVKGNLLGPVYMTPDYLIRAMTREELLMILFRINGR